MPTIKFPKNPNVDTAFVEQDDGTKNRALMIAPQDISTLELPNNPNSTKGYITVDGQKQRVILTADITGGGGGGSGLPDQTGHSGEFLTTDGTDASWAAVDSLPDQTGNAGKFLTTDGTDASWGDALPLSGGTMTGGLKYELPTTDGFNNSIPILSGTRGLQDNIISWGKWGVVYVGHSGQAVHFMAPPIPDYSGMALGDSMLKWGNVYTQKLNNGANITVPTIGGAMAIQVSSMPTADSASLGVVVQFTGTTDANYTHGYIYECVSDGGNPATYSWTAVQVQAGGGGSLPSQTGHSGEILITDGTNASWGGTVKTHIRMEGGGYSSKVIGFPKTNSGNYVQLYANSQTELTLSSGSDWYAGGSATFSVNCVAPLNSNAKLGKNTSKWTNVYTTKINNGADITVPAVAGEMAVKQVNTTITLTAAGWSSNTQTVTVTGMTTTGVVLVSPDPTDQSAYTSAEIICTAQAADSLTFTCSTTPTADIDVNVVML